MLIPWCIHCKSVPFWMSEGFREASSVPKLRLAVTAPVGWCQGLAGVISTLSDGARQSPWKMTAAVCLMPERKRAFVDNGSFAFHRRSATESGRGGGGEIKTCKRHQMWHRICKTCEHAWCFAAVLWKSGCRKAGDAGRVMAVGIRGSQSRNRGSCANKKKKITD